MIRPIDAYALGRLLFGQGLNGELQAVSEAFRGIAEHLGGLPADSRRGAWEGFLLGRLDRAQILDALARVDPLGPPPEDKPGRLTAHLGDLSGANDQGRFTWPRWIVRGHFTLLTSDPKIGKTRIGMEMARRIYRALEWFDGQAPTFPEGTKTLWVPGDRQQDELRDLAIAYGLPPEAVLLNASPAEPYGGVSLDEPENVRSLRERVEIEHPGLVIIDTVWRATRRKLSREDEVNTLMDPLIEIAQECDVAMLGFMHASREGETLGRRLEGLARAVIKLSKPDPGQPARRKLWVDRANFLEPSPLGVTIHEAGCDFDSDPPADVGSNPGGRPPEKQEAAMAFIRAKLAETNDRIGNELCEEWMKSGGTKATFWRAVERMEKEGELVRSDGPGTRKPYVLHLITPGQGAGPEAP